MSRPLTPLRRVLVSLRGTCLQNGDFAAPNHPTSLDDQLANQPPGWFTPSAGETRQSVMGRKAQGLIAA